MWRHAVTYLEEEWTRGGDQTLLIVRNQSPSVFDRDNLLVGGVLVMWRSAVGMRTRIGRRSDYKDSDHPHAPVTKQTAVNESTSFKVTHSLAAKMADNNAQWMEMSNDCDIQGRTSLIFAMFIDYEFKLPSDVLWSMNVDVSMKCWLAIQL